MNRKGVCKTNSITDLNQCSVGEAVRYDRLGYISGVVGSRSVDLGGILSRESTTAMWSPATVSVYNNFATSEPSVGIGATNVPCASGVNNNLGVDQHVRRYDLLDHLFCELLFDLLETGIGVVLSGDQDVVDSERRQSSVLLFNVLKNDLALAVRAQPRHLPTVALVAHFFSNLVCQPV